MLHILLTDPPAVCKQPQVHSSSAQTIMQLSSRQQTVVLPAEQPDAGAPSSVCSPGCWRNARPGTEGRAAHAAADGKPFRRGGLQAAVVLAPEDRLIAQRKGTKHAQLSTAIL